MFRKLYSYLHFQSWRLGLWTPPDRKFLTRTLFAQLKKNKRILFVGVHDYTKAYPKYFPEDEFVTLDFDPKLSRYGSKHHICDNLLNLDKHALGEFDYVFMNGVIGYGLDQKADIEIAFEVLARHMKPGGELYLGTNPHLLSESEIESIQSLKNYYNESLPVHRLKQPWIKNIFHEYRGYLRKES